LSRFFINRPIFASVISIVIVLVGAITIPTLPVENVPNVTPPTVQVSASYPGANAQVVAETVTTPIEEQINGVDGMMYMSSKSSNDGSMNLTVTFEVGTDIDMATVLVQNRAARAQPKLPEDVKREGVTVEKQSTEITLMVNLISPKRTFNEIYLSNYATMRIKDVLTRVPGVGNVRIFGAMDYSMRIWLDPDKLAARDLTTLDVVSAIEEQNVQVAAGQIGAEPAPKGQVFQYTVKAAGRLVEVSQFENIIVKVGKDGRTVRVKDVARVELGSQDYSGYVEFDGSPSVAIAVYQQPGANALSVAGKVQEEMGRLAKGFPEDMQYAIAFNPTRFITASIREVVQTLLVAVMLVVLITYIFLQDWRTTMIPSITIPVSLVGTFAVMMALGLSINTLTLFGLVLAIGIVVDDSIVVVENTMRILDETHLPAKEATIKAMQQVTGPVIATTMVLLAVFVPTAMMPGITGRLYQQFALTISTATVFSSINALTLSPALCGLLLRPTPERRVWFFRGFNWLFDHSTNGYMRLVTLMVRRTVVVMLVFAALLGLTWVNLKAIPSGFLPDEDQGYFFVNVLLPEGASLQRTRKVLDRAGKILKTTPGVAHVITVGGYSILEGISSPNTGCFFVPLDPWDERPGRELHLEGIVGSVQRRLAGIEEAWAFAFGPPPIMGLGSATGFEFQLQDRGGAGVVLLETVANDLAHAATADPVLARMNNSFRANVPQFYLDVDRVRAKKYGVPLNSVFGTLQAFLGSLYVNDFTLFGYNYRVIVQADSPYRCRVDDINRLQVRNHDGRMIPLRSLLTVQDTVGPQTVTRYNLYPSASITGQTAPGYSSGQGIAEMERLARQTLPPSMGYEWTGVAYEQVKAGNLAPLIFLLALVFVFLFLAAQYESWSTPLAVILSVPVAVLGALLATWIRSLDNNIYTQIGLVLLIGLASKYAILIVEFAKQRHEQGRSIPDAAIEASRLRFRPLLMTAFSFVFGVMPLVIASGAGASARRSLGTAVFAGTLFAAILGVLFVPVLYVVVQKLSERVRGVGKPEAKPEPPAN